VEEIQPLVRIRGLTKVFGGQLALDAVDLTIMPNEIHGLLGENGSGKSTLIKILSGFHQSDNGSLNVSGVDIPLPLVPGQHRQLGFEFVHQDLGLVPSLSVTENLYLGSVAASHAPFFSWRLAAARAAKTFANYKVDINPHATIDSIRPVERAMLAIIRAVEGLREKHVAGTSKQNLLILDEPTVFLPQQEVGTLFDLLRDIAQAGSSVLFVSHDLDEVKEITDRVTVLRDGRTVGTTETTGTSSRDLIRMIVGHDLAEQEAHPESAPTGQPNVLSVQGLTMSLLTDVSFDLHEGEVLGFAGLVGSGYEDVVYSLFGAVPAASGTLKMADQVVDLRRLGPRKAMSLGMALVPADRKNDGSVATLSLAENLNLTVLDRFFSGGRLRKGKLRDNARQLLEEFDVRPPMPDLEYNSFSGGNQQKAMMAKWQQISPKVMLLHEPTQGVDVGARQQIYELIRKNTTTSATICASSDYEQLEAICDRVGIIVRGQLVAFVTGNAITKTRIADLCHGQVNDVEATPPSDPISIS